MGAWSNAKPHVPDLFKWIIASEVKIAAARNAPIVDLALYRAIFKNRRFLLRECERFCTHKNGGAP
jgi:hypothetical protein